MVCEYLVLIQNKANCIVIKELCPKTKLKCWISQKCWQIKSQSSNAKQVQKQPAGREITDRLINKETKLSTHDNSQSLDACEKPNDTAADKQSEMSVAGSQSPNPAGNFFQNRKPYHTPKSEIPTPADDTHKEAK